MTHAEAVRCLLAREPVAFNGALGVIVTLCRDPLDSTLMAMVRWDDAFLKLLSPSISVSVLAPKASDSTTVQAAQDFIDWFERKNE